MRDELESELLRVADEALNREGNILDIGCGTGYWLSRLEARGVASPRLHGIDVLADRVERARAALPLATVVQGDARSLPWSGDSFSLVLVFTVLSSLADRAAIANALAEARRVTAPGGMIVIYEPRVPNPFNRATIHVSRRALRGLGSSTGRRSLTVLPPLARALGPLTPAAYPLFAKVPLLRTHKLTWVSADLRAGLASDVL
ncbi:MAG: hypothetical protein QOJ29_934 [Thermoleophilaceae bacterium]|nr:hypothetical protein [Thermoleophilaceae bacterium]